VVNSRLLRNGCDLPTNPGPDVTQVDQVCGSMPDATPASPADDEQLCPGLCRKFSSLASCTDRDSTFLASTTPVTADLIDGGNPSATVQRAISTTSATNATKSTTKPTQGTVDVAGLATTVCKNPSMFIANATPSHWLVSSVFGIATPHFFVRGGYRLAWRCADGNRALLLFVWPIALSFGTSFGPSFGPSFRGNVATCSL
jgi:hypothetical protein